MCYYWKIVDENSMWRTETSTHEDCGSPYDSESIVTVYHFDTNWLEIAQWCHSAPAFHTEREIREYHDKIRRDAPKIAKHFEICELCSTWKPCSFMKDYILPDIEMED